MTVISIIPDMNEVAYKDIMVSDLGERNLDNAILLRLLISAMVRSVRFIFIHGAAVAVQQRSHT